MDDMNHIITMSIFIFYWNFLQLGGRNLNISSIKMPKSEQFGSPWHMYFVDQPLTIKLQNYCFIHKNCGYIDRNVSNSGKLSTNHTWLGRVSHLLTAILGCFILANHTFNSAAYDLFLNDDLGSWALIDLIFAGSRNVTFLFLQSSFAGLFSHVCAACCRKTLIVSVWLGEKITQQNGSKIS